MSELDPAINADIGDDWFEIIEGVKIMAASARGGHNAIASRIFAIIDNYFFDNNLESVTFPDVDVYLPDGNIFRPDVCVVIDPRDIGEDGKVHGVPALVVEVISPSTMNNDLGIKMTLYARNGVKEYWIIDPKSKNIFVYKLQDGYYTFDKAYHGYTRVELNELNENERAEINTKIPVGIFPEFSIDINRIFR